MDRQPPYFQLSTESVNGHQVITVTGEVDLCTSPALHDYLHDAATTIPGTTQGGGDLVLDLSALTFMNSSGLRVLLQADQRAARTGSRLRLAAMTAPITRLLMLMRLDAHFDVYPTLIAATSPAAGTEPAMAHANSSEPPASSEPQLAPPAWPHPGREEDHFAGIAGLRTIRSSPAWTRHQPVRGPGTLPGPPPSHWPRLHRPRWAR
ncbi:MAG: anti-anti-sigma factor [Actinomycetia bacterium]|nr:anti-anti-sigma factor [Actinomycetes bacterium]